AWKLKELSWWRRRISTHSRTVPVPRTAISSLPRTRTTPPGLQADHRAARPPASCSIWYHLHSARIPAVPFAFLRAGAAALATSRLTGLSAAVVSWQWRVVPIVWDRLHV